MYSQIHISCIAIVVLGAMCAGADTITLKKEAYVKGPTVYLGDVADVAGDDAAFLRTIPISTAAVPGGMRRIDASLVLSKVKQAGVVTTDVELRGASRTTTKTLYLEITDGMIAEDLRQYINREMPWEPESTVVQIMSTAKRYTVGDGELEFRWQRNPQYAYLGQGTFRGEILVDGRSSLTFYVKANIETYEKVIVASRGVSRGESFNTGNTKMDVRALSSVKSGAYFSLADLKPMVSKGSIMAGQVITPRKVVKRQIIKRGQLIPVETTMGAMTIRAEAQALSSAAVGDILTCRNIQSKEELVGVVREDGVLVVE